MFKDNSSRMPAGLHNKPHHLAQPPIAGVPKTVVATDHVVKQNFPNGTDLTVTHKSTEHTTCRG